MDWATNIFVWVHLPSERFHPGERSSIRVVARRIKGIVVCPGVRRFPTVECTGVQGC